MKNLFSAFFLFCITHISLAQETNGQVDTTVLLPIVPVNTDSLLRITNLNPFFTIHVDSTLDYDLEINKPAEEYYWYIKKAPVGVKLNRQTGQLFFKADKSLFKSGRLQYDVNYAVEVGVQNLRNPNDKVDTAFTMVFYSTEINASRLKPSVGSTIMAEEGDTIRFTILCEQGTFPVEQVTMLTNMSISGFTQVRRCDDEFKWFVPYDFIKDTDTAKQKNLVLQFISADKFFNRDTSVIRINIRPGIDFPQKYLEHAKVSRELSTYIQQLKLSFYVISDNLKKNKSTRTAFDISSSTTALAGTILATTAESESAQNIGKVLPSVGLTLVPVKEAVAPNKIQEQNTAAQVRSITKRLEYLLSENQLIGNKDPLVLQKTTKLSDELRQARLQLVDLPLVEYDGKLTPEDADKYFTDPKVNKKYKLKID